MAVPRIGSRLPELAFANAFGRKEMVLHIMTDRWVLLDAIERMTRQFPVYFDEDVVGHLTSSDAIPVPILLGALVEMVDRCLQRYEDGLTKYDVDTIAQSAGEHAVLALAQFGLMERISVRFGQWTPAGKALLASGLGEWEQYRDKVIAEAEAERREAKKYAEAARHERQLRWTKYALIAGFVAMVSVVAGWIAISLPLAI